MKLIGIELINFACFDRQFVPLREGISVLVGKNNVGKTAILRGLSALHALPIGSVIKTPPTNLDGYSRNQKGGFDFEVLFRIDESDAKTFVGAPEEWLETVYERGVARWRFAVSIGGQVTFQNGTFDLPAISRSPISAVFISRSNDACFAHQLHFPDMGAVTARAVTSRSFGEQNPVFDSGSPFSAPLETISNVKLINPHRVVADRQTLQTVIELPGDAQNLGQFLQTLYGQDRDAFEEIEALVKEIFPEFKHVNPVSRANNQLSLELTEVGTGRKIPLSNCGTGVEQILTLATFVITNPKPGLILLDEPHSYLHPTAERALVQFLHDHPEHKYIISTHSAVLMNSVKSDQIIYVSPPGQPYKQTLDRTEVPKVLFDLGYRNSDALFHDRLVLVEGKSDKAILPILLLADGEISQSDLRYTGFPVLDGVGKGSIALQTAILRFEALLGATGRADQPRIYLFDADRRDDENTVLKGTHSPVTGMNVKAEFLPRLEIENYLLVSEAISAAIQEELILTEQPQDVTSDKIEAVLKCLLESKENNLFPQGGADDREPEKRVKGSFVLKKLYEGFCLQYDKQRSGTLIAKHISAKNQPALSELTTLVRPIFPKALKKR